MAVMAGGMVKGYRCSEQPLRPWQPVGRHFRAISKSLRADSGGSQVQEVHWFL